MRQARDDWDTWRRTAWLHAGAGGLSVGITFSFSRSIAASASGKNRAPSDSGIFRSRCAIAIPQAHAIERAFARLGASREVVTKGGHLENHLPSGRPDEPVSIVKSEVLVSREGIEPPTY